MDGPILHTVPELELNRSTEDVTVSSSEITSARLAQVIPLGLAIFLLFLYIKSSVKAWRSPLSKIPGPWYAPFTTLHLRYGFAEGTIWKYVERQHKHRGEVLRLGPRQIWVSGKEAVRDILVKTDLPKVSMYAEISRDRNSPGLFGEM